MTAPIRVLIVDDSAFVRKVLRELLGVSAEIEVVGIARDGLDALEKVAELNPDVLTLDLMMPNLDGLGVLEGLPLEGAPRVIVVSTSDGETELGAAALQAGALDIVRKPTALATDQLYEVRDELIRKVKHAAAARPRRFTSLVGQAAPTTESRYRDVIVVGTSTGGPQAITRLLAALPGSLPVPIVIALHIPFGYTEALAARLDAGSALDVREAQDGIVLRPGLAVLARGGAHVRIVRRGEHECVAVDTDQGGAAYAPSVDVLFESAAGVFGSRTLGVVLTGMGDDGLLGSSAIHRAGGSVLTESERSCVVYGMPRCVQEAGYSAAQAP
ncbi:MAG TPA: chemotaxis-specific protein-glutamate methyltransferase CheB, partial [Polyangiaceae bacterium]